MVGSYPGGSSTGMGTASRIPEHSMACTRVSEKEELAQSAGSATACTVWTTGTDPAAAWRDATDTGSMASAGIATQIVFWAVRQFSRRIFWRAHAKG